MSYPNYECPICFQDVPCSNDLEHTVRWEDYLKSMYDAGQAKRPQKCWILQYSGGDYEDAYTFNARVFTDKDQAEVVLAFCHKAANIARKIWDKQDSRIGYMEFKGLEDVVLAETEKNYRRVRRVVERNYSYLVPFFPEFNDEEPDTWDLDEVEIE